MKKPLIAAIVLALAIGGFTAVPAQAASTAAITGRALSDKGTPISGLTVIAGSKSTTTDRAGKFVLAALKPGTYMIEFTDPAKHRYLTEFLGDSPTASGADTITVAAGEKHTGVSERLTHAALISGVVTVDGHPADELLGSIGVTLTDAAGHQVAHTDLSKPTFSFPGVPAGAYTLNAAEQDVAYPHLVAATLKVTVAPGQQLNDQALAMKLVKGVVQASHLSVTVKHIGANVKITATATSYVDVHGGVITLKYHGGLHETATVPANGRASITIPTSSWKRASIARVDVIFDGPMGVDSSKATAHFVVG